MKEKGLILTKDNRLASVEGRQTQIRRIVKPQPTYIERLPTDALAGETAILDGELWECSQYSRNIPDAIKWRLVESPYQVGDHLYSKEPIFIHCGGKHWGKEIGTQFGYSENPEKSLRTVHVAYDYAHSYRYASQMPRYAARYWFEVIKVRVERNDKEVWEWVYDYKKIEK